MNTREPEAAPDNSTNHEQLFKDARAFGIEVANSVQAELEGRADEERLQAIQDVFMQAVAHVEQNFGLIIGTQWMEETNRAMQQRFAELNNDSGPDPDL